MSCDEFCFKPSDAVDQIAQGGRAVGVSRSAWASWSLRYSSYIEHSLIIASMESLVVMLARVPRAG